MSVDAACCCARTWASDTACRAIAARSSSLGANLQLARLELRDEEQIVHEPEQAVGVVVDDVEIASLLFGQVAVVQRQLEIADDRGQRRAQLVRDERHELVHEPCPLRASFGVAEVQGRRRRSCCPRRRSP